MIRFRRTRMRPKDQTALKTDSTSSFSHAEQIRTRNWLEPTEQQALPVAQWLSMRLHRRGLLTASPL